MSTTTVGIAGITGKFARCVVGHLLKNPQVTIRGYCRDPSKLPTALSSSPRIQIIQGQANDQHALRAFVKGSDVIICAYLGDKTLMIDGQKSLIDACETEEVPRYIASDYTLDFTKLELGQLPQKDPMKHVMEYLKGKKVQGVHVFIGIFMETFFNPFIGAWNPKDTSFSYWGTGEEMWESTTYDNAAQFVAAVAQDSSAVGVQRFLGDRKNVQEIASAFEKTYGIKPSLKNNGSLQELHARMHQAKKENPTNYFAWMSLFYHYYCTNGETHLFPELDACVYPGVPRLTFDEFFASHSLESLATANSNVGSE